MEREISAELLTDIGVAVKNIITSVVPGTRVNVNVVTQPKPGLWIELDAELYPRFVQAKAHLIRKAG